MGTARACVAAGEGAPVWKKRALGPALNSSFQPWHLGNSSGRRASPELQSRAASGTPGVAKNEPPKLPAVLLCQAPVRGLVGRRRQLGTRGMFKNPGALVVHDGGIKVGWVPQQIFCSGQYVL